MLEHIVQAGITEWLDDITKKCEKKLWANVPFAANAVIQDGKLTQITVQGVHHKL